MISRISLLKGALVVAVVVVGVRLFFVQIVEHDDWVARADAEHIKQLTIPAKRGKIYMMDSGEPVAAVMNEPVWTVFVDPKMVKDEKKVERAVVETIGEKVVVEDWGKVWEDKERRYVVIARNVSRKEAAALKEKGFYGVGMTETVRRVYPEGELAAQVLGFVNGEGKGQYGVEGYLDKDLQGEAGFLKTVTDVNNVPLTIGSDNVRIPAQDGKDVVLSIERSIQRAAEKAIKNGVERSGGEYANAVVMDPNTGKILAMANYPSYDPAEYWKVGDAGIYMNQVTMSTYEPASVIKTFTFATGIDIGVLGPTTKYRNTGSTMVGTEEIYNSEPWRLQGEITIQDAFNMSFNTGSVEALRLFDGGKITRKGEETLYDYFYNKFGIGKKTGVEIAGETVGIIHSPESLSGRGEAKTYADMTYGQGMTATMMEVAAGFSAIVNGGEYYAPSVIAGKMENGEFVKSEAAEAKWRAVSGDTSETVRQMLMDARYYQGDPEGYVIGGKTGSAQVAVAGGYSDTTAIASYIGFLGKELPEYVIMVRIGGEGKNMRGSRDAEPMFNEIVGWMMDNIRLNSNSGRER